MIYLGNAFSLQMLPAGAPVSISVLPTTGVAVRNHLQHVKFTCCIGHQDTASVVADALGLPGVVCNRVNVELKPGDVLYVAQLTGGRLPEGAATLPEGFKLNWLRVSLDSPLTETLLRPAHGSIHGSIFSAAQKVAETFGVDATPCEDVHGNFFATIEDRGISARFWDE